MNEPDGNPKACVALFQKRQIRRMMHNNEWWFVITDIIAALADSTYPSDYWKKMRKRDPDLGKALQRGGNLSPFTLEFATVGRTHKAAHRMLPSYRSEFLSKRVIQNNLGSCFGNPLSGNAIH